MPNRPAAHADTHRSNARRYVAFVGTRLVAEGSAVEVARAARRSLARSLARSREGALLAFDAATSEPLELDLRGTEAEIVARLQGKGGATGVAADRADDDPDESRGPGRPRLGVVGREVTLLPRHWEWLNAQPGGASAALRRLVDAGRAGNAVRDRTRRAQEYAYRFLAAMLGDAPGFEEATRALFARDRERFTALTDAWPADPRDHARRLADSAWPTP